MLVRFITHLFWVLMLLAAGGLHEGAEGAGMVGAESVVVVVAVVVPAVGVG